MSEPVSIIIPLYNRKHLITRCVQSVLRQTYPHLEIIIVNDGSTDGCEPVLEKLAKDPRVHVLHQPNGGVSSARNRGLDKATGVYVQFVDSDDELVPQATEHALNTLRDTETDLVVFKRHHSCNPTMPTGSVRRVLREDDCTYAIMKEGAMGVPWNKLYKRELIGDIRFPKDVSWGEDFIFNLAYVRRCRHAAILNEGLYIQHDSGNDSLCARYDVNGFRDAQAQARAIDTYLHGDNVHPQASKLMKSYLWGCYIACVRKLCLRSGLPTRDIRNILRLWAADDLVRDIAEAALSDPWDCRCLRDKRLQLLPWAVRFCYAKARLGAWLRDLMPRR